MPKNGNAMMYTSGWPKTRTGAATSYTAVGRVVDVRAEVTVRRQAEQRGGQQRK